MILMLVAAILLVNAVYCVRKIWEDLRAGRRALASVGIAGIVGVYGLIGWVANDITRSVVECLAVEYGP